jgi:HlyD family secretion protein
MQNRHPPRIAVFAILVVALIAAYYALRAWTAAGNGRLTASGTIEAVTVDVSPELGGLVKAVLVEEGAAVAAGSPLLVLDDTLLQEQRKGAVAALESARAAGNTAARSLEVARAQYQQALEASLAEGRESRLQDWFAKDQLQFDQPEWYFSRAEQIAAVQVQIDKSKTDWESATDRLDKVAHSLNAAEFLRAEARLLQARIAYQVSKDVNERAQNSTDEDAPQGRYNRTHCGTNEGYVVDNPRLTNVIYSCTGDEHLSAISKRQFDDAQAELQDAQGAYSALLNSSAADEMLAARAEVEITQERYYAALDRLSALRTSDFAPKVVAAQGAVDQAQAAYDQSLRVVQQAQAGLDLMDAQLEKMSLSSPLDGVVLTRIVEPGELVQPASVVLSLGDLTNLTITVYVPEDRYGQISLNQAARVRVDSFPDLYFDATVIHVADQAEFTPRNVQTVEGRSATVYAVKLKVADPGGRLKPGMPADVDFSG